MLIWTLIKISLKGLWANKMRSFLAVLGIIIGVGAVITMLALAEGAKKEITKKVSSLGSDLMVIRPGQKENRGVRNELFETISLKDAETLLKKVPEILHLSPVVRSGAQVKYLSSNTNVPVTGAALTYFAIRNFTLQKGRAFSEPETLQMARVAVIGAQTAEDLFGKQDPIGKIIKVTGLNFKIIGLLEVKGDQGWYNPDNQLIIPYTTAMKRLFGLKHLGGIDLQLKKGVNPTLAEEKINRIMRDQHRLPPEMPSDFTLQSQAELLKALNSVSMVLTMLLGGIASISLLVGGIGIMNIMLVTVTERTREIGIRKALGAKNGDILRQFLFESILLSLLGGGIGIGLGFLSCYLINTFSTSMQTFNRPFYVFIAFSFSAAVGIFFGFYPAFRAAKQNPIDALRYE